MFYQEQIIQLERDLDDVDRILWAVRNMNTKQRGLCRMFGETKIGLIRVELSCRCCCMLCINGIWQNLGKYPTCSIFWHSNITDYNDLWEKSVVAKCPFLWDTCSRALPHALLCLEQISHKIRRSWGTPASPERLWFVCTVLRGDFALMSLNVKGVSSKLVAARMSVMWVY